MSLSAIEYLRHILDETGYLMVMRDASLRSRPHNWRFELTLASALARLRGAQLNRRAVGRQIVRSRNETKADT